MTAIESSFRSHSVAQAPRASPSPVEPSKDLSGRERPAASMSTLGKTLADAVQRAEERDNGMSQRELRALAERIDHKVFEGDWRIGWETLAAQKPKDADEARIELSRNVTDFMKQFNAVAGRGPTIRNANPFYGVDMAALSAIQYDDSGAFTVNERRAALIEWNRQDYEWAVQVCARITTARSRNESLGPIYKDILESYSALPPIQRAILPEGYMDRLRSLVESSEKADAARPPEHPTMPLLLRWLGIAR